MNDEIAVLRMQGGKANALRPEFLERLSGLLDAFDDSPARAGVLTGYDKFFSAGLDLVTLSALDRDGMGDFMRLFSRVMSRLYNCPRPVVAALNGHAVAGGCVLALVADWRAAADGKLKIGLNETQLGVGLPTAAAVPLVTRLTPRSAAIVALEGGLHDPARALDLGLVDEVVPPAHVLDRALDKAREFAAVPPLAFAQTKGMLRQPGRTALANDTSIDGWLDTWFSDAARTRIDAVVAQLRARA